MVEDEAQSRVDRYFHTTEDVKRPTFGTYVVRSDVHVRCGGDCARAGPIGITSDCPTGTA